jgi:hypothetical protein
VGSTPAGRNITWENSIESKKHYASYFPARTVAPKACIAVA